MHVWWVFVTGGECPRIGVVHYFGVYVVWWDILDQAGWRVGCYIVGVQSWGQLWRHIVCNGVGILIVAYYVVERVVGLYCGYLGRFESSRGQKNILRDGIGVLGLSCVLSLLRSMMSWSHQLHVNFWMWNSWGCHDSWIPSCSHQHPSLVNILAVGGHRHDRSNELA